MLRESDLFAPIAAWLREDGYRVYAECFGHDLLAVKGTRLVGVEMKLHWSRKLFYQCNSLVGLCEATYAAVGATPSWLAQNKCAKLGIGLIQVSKTGNLYHHHSPVERELSRQWDWKRARVMRMLAKLPEDLTHVGGVPCLKGVGPAVRVYALVKAYRDAHPKAGWKEIFEHVPNYYAHPDSLRCAMRSIKNRGVSRVGGRRSPVRSSK